MDIWRKFVFADILKFEKYDNNDNSNHVIVPQQVTLVKEDGLSTLLELFTLVDMFQHTPLICALSQFIEVFFFLYAHVSCEFSSASLFNKVLVLIN